MDPAATESVGPSFWPELADHYGAVCFTDTLELTPSHHVQSGQGVLVIAPQDGLIESLAGAMDAEGLYLSPVPDAEAAHELLKKDEDIAFILSDTPADATLQQTIDLLNQNRLHVAWTRLPHAVLLAPTLLSHEAELREAGAMAALLAKPIEPAALIDHIKHAQAR